MYERTSVRAYEPANSHRDAAYSQQLHCSSAFEKFPCDKVQEALDSGPQNSCSEGESNVD
jgi:hypothetical protein